MEYVDVACKETGRDGIVVGTSGIVTHCGRCVGCFYWMPLGWLCRACRVDQVWMMEIGIGMGEAELEVCSCNSPRYLLTYS